MKFLFFLILKQSLIFIHAQVQQQKLDLHKILGQRPLLPSEGYMNIRGLYFALKIDLHILKPVITKKSFWLNRCCGCSEPGSMLQEWNRCTGLISMPKRWISLLLWKWWKSNQDWWGWWAPHADLKAKGQNMPCVFPWHLLKDSEPLLLDLPEIQGLFPWAQMGLGPSGKSMLTTDFNPVSADTKASYHESCTVQLSHIRMSWRADAPLANPQLSLSL